LGRPQKGFRKEFVRVGFLAIQPEGPTAEQELYLQAAGDAIEALHSGSLIVDDIQDGSQVRRGSPTLHLQHGIPKALNAGNWLYFHSFQIIRKTGMPASTRLALYEAIEETLLEAHAGQALDLGSQMNSRLVPAKMVEICQASLVMKSGALFRLAVEMGALIAEGNVQQVEFLRNLGLQTGLCLQMFDDLGNLNLRRPTAKHLEDLILRRPSFVWWTLAEEFPDRVSAFSNAVDLLPELTDLHELLLKTPLVEQGMLRATKLKNSILAEWSGSKLLSETAFVQFKELIERISNAYK